MATAMMASNTRSTTTADGRQKGDRKARTAMMASNTRNTTTAESTGDIKGGRKARHSCNAWYRSD